VKDLVDDDVAHLRHRQVAGEDLSKLVQEVQLVVGVDDFRGEAVDFLLELGGALFHRSDKMARTRCATSRGLKGWVMYSSAPPSSARSRSICCPLALSMITYVASRLGSCLTCSQTS